MKLLILDNYDSFTYNLVQYFKLMEGVEVTVVRNDQITVAEAGAYDAFVFSPGPGLPAQAGILLELIKTYAGKRPMLGVCLGHQAIAEAFGGSLHNLSKVYHGIATPIQVTQSTALYEGLPTTDLVVGRYHSWVVAPDNLPADLSITAVDETGAIMALQHKQYPIVGVQFHPESVLSPEGPQLLQNFIEKIATSSLVSH